MVEHVIRVCGIGVDSSASRVADLGGEGEGEESVY